MFLRFLFRQKTYCMERIRGMNAPWPNNNQTQILEKLGAHIEMCAEQLRGLSVVKLCIGGDNFGIFNGRSQNWSMGAFFMAPDDIPLDVKWKRAFHWPLLLIPGPKQIPKMHSICRMMVNELKRYAPTFNGGGDCIWVRPNSDAQEYASLKNAQGGT